MKKWKLNYALCSTFDGPVTKHSFSLRCFPREMILQKVENLNIDVEPCSGFSRGRDSFQNLLVTGCIENAHEIFQVHVSADVAKGAGDEPDSRESYRLGMYKTPTSMTKCGVGLNSFYEKIEKRTAEDDWTRAAQIMDMIYRSFHYVSGSTGFYTSAEEAWHQGCGVCQDYTHIFMALCRKEKMIVRYVAGAIPGEGQTHAWAQVWQNGFWRGFDPTHNRITDEDYLCFAFGREAGDCFLNRGIYLGSAGTDQKVLVKMEEIQNDE